MNPSAMLHITNGDSAADQLRIAGISGKILPWRDVLHEGPVPAGLSLDSLREVRARFIAGRNWGTLEDVLRQFTERDAILEMCCTFGETILWFGNDLFDQLQLLQILHWFHEESPGECSLSLICVDEALATVPPERAQEMLRHRRAPTNDQIALASRAWTFFRSPDPSDLEELAKEGSPSLPFLAAALFRHLQQFPSTRNGLSLSEHNALDAIVQGRSHLREAFVASHHEREEPIFLGDAVFATYLEGLSDVEVPLLTFDDDTPVVVPRTETQGAPFWERRVTITKAGKDVLTGKLDNVHLNGIDRWLGGVYSSGRGAIWRWDGDTQSLRYC